MKIAPKWLAKWSVKWSWGLIVALLICGIAPALQAQDGEMEILAPWQAQGRVFQVGPAELQFIGTFEGVMYFEGGTGELDAAIMVCPATQEINTENGRTEAHGRCMITTSEGNDVFAEFQCKGVVGACKGGFKITGGTGKLEGMTGSSDMLIRSALGSIAVDAKSGSVIQSASGIAVWPNLKYTIPSN